MRTLLDRFYALTLWLAGLCLVAIGLMVLAQVTGRVVDGLLKLIGRPPYGFVILSLSEIAGYLLAAASFLALAGTLKAGAHIRVTMMLSAVGEGLRRMLELAAFAGSAAFSAYMTWWIALLAFDSWRNTEVSSGLIPVPLVWPQAAMALGLLAVTIALVDEAITILSQGRPTFRAAEDAITLGKEG